MRYLKATFLLLCGSVLCACKGPQPVDNADALVKVKERILKRSEVASLIPKGTSVADSLLLAESIVKKWVKDALVYELAERNLGEEKDEIDRLVEDYRHSLVRYRYQERLVREKLSADIRESDMLNYYQENKEKFLLDKSLIKGLFLKIPVDAPSLSEVKKWYKSDSEAALEKIEKYSIQNAVIYDYFYDRWVDFDEVMDNIPLHISHPTAFLKANKGVEVADSSYCYLLNIKEYLPAGTTAPYDFASPQIKDMLVNQRKVEFLRNFENELYNDAVRRGHVKFYTEP